MRVFFHWLLLPVLVLGLAACDSNDDDGGSGGANNAPGSGSITVTGDVNRSFTGNAVFTVGTDEGQQYWSAVLVNGSLANQDDVGESVILGGMGGRPATGDYEFGADTLAQVVGVYARGEGDQLSLFAVADSGELTITESSASRLRGEFEFSATAFDTSDPQNPQEINVTVSGTFNAVFIDPGQFPDDEVRPSGRLALPVN